MTPSLMPARPDAWRMLDPSSLSIVIVIVNFQHSAPRLTVTCNACSALQAVSTLRVRMSVTGNRHLHVHLHMPAVRCITKFPRRTGGVTWPNDVRHRECAQKLVLFTETTFFQYSCPWSPRTDSMVAESISCKSKTRG